MEATCEKEIAALVLFVRHSHFRPIAELICGPQRIGGRGVTEWKEERVEGDGGRDGKSSRRVRRAGSW